MDKFEKHILRQYVLCAVGANEGGEYGLKGRPSRSLLRWLFENISLLEIAEPSEIDPDDLEPGTLNSVKRAVWGTFLPLVDELRAPQPVPPTSGLEKRLEWLCSTLALSSHERQVLKLAVRVSIAKPFYTLGRALTQSEPGTGEVNFTSMAKLTGISTDKLHQLLMSTQPLRLLGLLEDRRGGDFAPSSIVTRIARMSTASPKRLRAELIGKTSDPQLAWSDFTHLGAIRDLAERALQGALSSRETGVSLLLHGEPGTGKTEFARTLAARLGAQAVFVGEADRDGDEPSRESRLAAFALVRALAGRAGQTILVVDEAEEIFIGVDGDERARRNGSKVFMNRLIEQTEAPTIWITNHPDRLGQAVVRRMALAIRFREPGPAIRRTVVGRVAARRKIELSSEELDHLSRLPAAPAVIDGAFRVASLGRGQLANDASLAARSILEAMGSEVMASDHQPDQAFDPTLSAADHNLQELADRIAAAGPKAISLCLYGLSGTGKSAYARYLAQRLGMEVLEKRASDLLSMWVGGTEKSIARAFQEAIDTGSFMILDEADSLLRDRTGAQAGWEVSQVNEMLTWMERHPLPFACTTNLMDSLDPATLRRFLVKVQFLPMSPSQVRKAFELKFGATSPKELDQIKSLTPGDFEVINRKVRLLGESDPNKIVKMLALEVTGKPNSFRGKLGFDLH